MKDHTIAQWPARIEGSFDSWVATVADIQIISDMIELEVFLFGGVPEIPNPVYGRDSYGNVHARLTRTGIGRSQRRGSPETGRESEILLQKIRIDSDAGTIEFGEFLPGDVQQ